MKNKKENKYYNLYSEEKFWAKIKQHIAVIGKKILERAFILYYLYQDKNIPDINNISIYSALGYLILPIDAIPDIMPLIGYSDDATVLLATIKLMSKYITKEHKIKAKNKVEELLKKSKKE
jgi:uncharacterized membrane protein YkvA (DUF1232 family)